MQSTERQKFEENWKSAFDGTEMTPSDNVWNSIELDLAGQESATMKKRVVFYQRVAAATILFALLTGTYAFYTNYNKTESSKSIVENKVNSQKTVPEEIKSNSTNRPEPKDPTEATSLPRQTALVPEEKPVKEQGVKQEAVAQSNVIANDISPIDEHVAATQTLAQSEAPKDESVTEKPVEQVSSPLLQTAPLVASLEPQDQPERAEKKKNRGENTWLALGASGGSYAPNSGVSASAPAASAAYSGPLFSNLDVASSNDNKTKIGTSYSVGVAVGKKFGRFVVQSGINLNKQQVDYTSSYDSRNQTSNMAKASMADYNMSEAASLSPTAAYTVNSSMEIVSIPVQAGYMIIDRKLGWQMNAGISPDFFLSNTLVDKSGQRERFKQLAGDDSPYRSVNWSGLLNTELSYRIGEHYRLSLVPGVRYSFNSILKEPGDSGKPLILDVGFRFKYLFD